MRQRHRPNGMIYRRACGHYADSPDGGCEDCTAGGSSIDVWEVAGDDVNLNRLAETRSYRQSKFRRV